MDSAGLDGSDEMVEWIWNTGFASVSSDQPALEAWPCPPGAKYLESSPDDYMIDIRSKFGSNGSKAGVSEK